MRAVAIALFCMGLASPADAQTDEETSTRLEALFGEHEPYEVFLAALKEAVAARDKEAVAAMIAYPLNATIGGDRVALDSQGAFVRSYDRLLTPAVASAVDRQTYATLFATAEGVMIGDGEIWFSGICGDASCSDVSVKIIAIHAPDAGQASGSSGAER